MSLYKRWRAWSAAWAVMLLTACAHLPDAKTLLPASSNTAQPINEHPVAPPPPAPAPRQPFTTGAAPLGQDHVLNGRIWDVRQRRFVTPQQLLQAMRAHEYVLLGEKHDNPDHHHLQFDVLHWLGQRKLLAQVSMEMLDERQQAALQRYRGQRALDDEALRQALAWDDRRWPWAFYGPIIRFALEQDVAVVPANLTPAEVKAVYAGQSVAPLPPLLISEQGEALTAKQRRVVHEAHCGLLPEAQLPAMVRVQQARDQRMMRSLLEAPQHGVAVLLAGGHHVRRDIGVPLWLQVYEPSARVLSIALLEVLPEQTQAAQYLQETSAMPAFDFLWFTPRVTDQDYCDSLRRPAS